MKLVSHITSFLRRKARTTNSDILPDEKKKEYRDSLAPCILNEVDDGYCSVKDLEFAIDDKKCRNVALTGVYGSGKSTVIETYVRECENPKSLNRHKALRISLSTFKDSEEGEENINDIEYKLLQHIIYKSDTKRTGQSRFDRIRHNPSSRYIGITFYVFSVLCAFIILYEPKFLQVKSIYDLYYSLLGYDIGTMVNTVVDVLSGLWLLMALLQAIFYVIRKLSKIHLKGIKTEQVAVELCESDAVFSKYLDEIVYFFKANEYDIVIFEDLDRMRHTQMLLLHLREINMLLNESEDFKGRRITFIYSIKDELFNGEVRTKCFDYIVPIIPVVDKFNVGDYLRKHYAGIFDSKIDEAILSELGLEITSMRELKNVVNEYISYKKLLLTGNTSMSEVKLFAMTIYKNRFPEDYSKSHQKQGLLYAIFNTQGFFDTEDIINTRANIKAITEEIELSHKKVLNVRRNVADWLYINEHVEYLIVGTREYKLDQVISDDNLFKKFRRNQIDRYYFIDRGNEESGTVQYDFKFDAIAEKVFNGSSYDDVVSQDEGDIYEKSLEKGELENKVRLYDKSSVQSRLLAIGDPKQAKQAIIDKYKELTEKEKNIENKEVVDTSELPELLFKFIRRGYIDDDYPFYISYHHSGAIVESDYTFINSVLQGISNEYFYPLKNAPAIYEKLHADNYDYDCILNFDLLKHLLVIKDEVLIDKFVGTARRNLVFVANVIDSKILSENQLADFMHKVFYKWDRCVVSIFTEENKILRGTLMKALFKECPKTLSLNDEELALINAQYHFICENIEDFKEDKICKFIKSYKLSFDKLEKPTEQTKQVYDYVVGGCAFKINTTNLEVIFGDGFNEAAFSAIENCGSKSLHIYLYENIEALIKSVPETSVKESPQLLINIFNDERIPEDWLKEYISKQQQQFDDINGLVDNRLWIVLETSHLTPTWKNINDCFITFGEVNEHLQAFLNKHVDFLVREKASPDYDDLQKALLCNQTIIPASLYSSFASCFSLQMFATDIQSLPEERILCLVRQDLLECSDVMLSQLSQMSSDAVAEFIVKHFDKIITNYQSALGNYVDDKIGTFILDSKLTLQQKHAFLKDVVSLMGNGALSSKYASVICFYYTQFEQLDDEHDLKLSIAALEANNEVDQWRVKITLINIINRTYPYEIGRENIMLKTLGGEYLKLTYYNKSAVFDNNQENTELLSYLKDNSHFVHNYRLIEYKNSRYKVTFKQ